jgi:hypothetical protein
MLALIDGDIFRYRCAFAAEKNYYLLQLKNESGYVEYKEFETKRDAELYGDRALAGTRGGTILIWSRRQVQPLENALQIVKGSLTQTLEDIKRKYGHVESRIFISGPTNFREDVAITKTYKGNRADTAKPVHYVGVGEYLIGMWRAEITEGIEADDAIGITAMACKERNEQYCVVSNDKDLTQIPGLHYNWVAKEFKDVSPEEAKRKFYEQLLSGDTTDNIPGLAGIGKVKAANALAECKSPSECLDVCVKMYQEFAGDDWVNYFIEQANLVFILRRRGIIWENTTEGIDFHIKYKKNHFGEEKQEQVQATA